MAVSQAALNLDAGYPANFFRWLQANAHIYTEFERRALYMARDGRKHYSAKKIAEEIRWDTTLQDTDKQFSLNNNYTSGCARLFMERHGEQYKNFFQLRDSLGQAA